MNNILGVSGEFILLRISDEFEQYSKYSAQFSNYWYLLALPLAIGMIWWLLTYIEKYVNQNNKSSKGKTPAVDLFVTLCRVHALSPGEVKILTTVAELNKLKNPALLFVDPRHFSKMPRKQSGVNEYDILRKKLFGKEVGQELEVTSKASVSARAVQHT